MKIENKDTYICDLCKNQFDKESAQYGTETHFCGSFHGWVRHQKDMTKKYVSFCNPKNWISWRSYCMQKDGTVIHGRLYNVEDVCNKCALDIENYILSKIEVKGEVK